MEKWLVDIKTSFMLKRHPVDVVISRIQRVASFSVKLLSLVLVVQID